MPSLNDFLSRVQTDYAFYLQFRASPQDALAPYELSSEERAALAEVDPQLWVQLGRFVPDAESRKPDSRAGVSANLGTTFKWTIHTTQVGWIQIDQPSSGDAEFNAEGVLRRGEVQESIAQIHATSTRADRLAAVLKLVEYIG
jgi:hypothetical protein